MAFVKLIEQEPGRPNGRLRVRVLHEQTNSLVCDESGRTMYFASEEAAEDWIQAARVEPPAPETLRTWRP